MSRLTPEREAEIRRTLASHPVYTDEQLFPALRTVNELLDAVAELDAVRAELAKVTAERDALLAVFKAADQFMVGYPWQTAPETDELRYAIAKAKGETR